MMQYVGKCDDIQAVVFDRIQLLDLVAVKNKVEIVKIKDIACYNV